MQESQLKDIMAEASNHIGPLAPQKPNVICQVLAITFHNPALAPMVESTLASQFPAKFVFSGRTLFTTFDVAFDTSFVVSKLEAFFDRIRDAQLDGPVTKGWLNEISPQLRAGVSKVQLFECDIQRVDILETLYLAKSLQAKRRKRAQAKLAKSTMSDLQDQWADVLEGLYPPLSVYGPLTVKVGEILNHAGFVDKRASRLFSDELLHLSRALWDKSRSNAEKADRVAISLEGSGINHWLTSANIGEESLTANTDFPSPIKVTMSVAAALANVAQDLQEAMGNDCAPFRVDKLPGHLREQLEDVADTIRVRGLGSDSGHPAQMIVGYIFKHMLAARIANRTEKVRQAILVASDSETLEEDLIKGHYNHALKDAAQNTGSHTRPESESLGMGA